MADRQHPILREADDRLALIQSLVELKDYEAAAQEERNLILWGLRTILRPTLRDGSPSARVIAEAVLRSAAIDFPRW